MLPAPARRHSAENKTSTQMAIQPREESFSRKLLESFCVSLTQHLGGESTRLLKLFISAIAEIFLPSSPTLPTPTQGRHQFFAR